MCRIKESDSCFFCGSDVETLEHLFWDCPIVNILWDKLVEWLAPCLDVSTYLNLKTVMLGVSLKLHSNLVNHLMLITKRYIYVSKCKENRLHFEGLRSEINKAYLTELNIIMYNAKFGNNKAQRKWEILDPLLKT